MQTRESPCEPSQPTQRVILNRYATLVSEKLGADLSDLQVSADKLTSNFGKLGTSGSSSAMADEIKDLVSANAVVLFIDPYCPYCVDAIKTLTAKGVDHKAIEATSSQRAALRSLTGMSSVPSSWVKGQFVGGCNDGPEPWMGIKKMANNGELQKRLSA